MDRLVLGVAVIVSAVAVLYFWYMQNSLRVTRESEESVKVTSSRLGNFHVSFERSFKYHYIAFLDHLDDDILFPDTYTFNGGTMFDSSVVYDIEGGGGEAIPVLLINPRLPNAVSSIKKYCRLFEKEERIDYEELNNVASKGYLFFRWVIRSQEDAELLKAEIVRHSSGERLPTEIPGLVSIRLDIDYIDLGSYGPANLGVEIEKLELGIDVAEAYGMTPKEFAATVPIMIERITKSRREEAEYMYVLYLDGHYEKILMGEKFPAMVEFVDLYSEM